MFPPTLCVWSVMPVTRATAQVGKERNGLFFFGPRAAPFSPPNRTRLSSDYFQKIYVNFGERLESPCQSLRIAFSSFSFSGCTYNRRKVPGLGAEAELQLLVNSPATATPAPCRICNPCHSSQQRWIFNPLSKARD